MSGNINAPSKDRDDFVRTTMLSARAYSSLKRDAQQFSFLLKNKRNRSVPRLAQQLRGGQAGPMRHDRAIQVVQHRTFL